MKRDTLADCAMHRVERGALRGDPAWKALLDYVLDLEKLAAQQWEDMAPYRPLGLGETYQPGPGVSTTGIMWRDEQVTYTTKPEVPGHA